MEDYLCSTKTELSTLFYSSPTLPGSVKEAPSKDNHNDTLTVKEGMYV